LNFTEVVPVNLVPLIITRVPTLPLVGVKVMLAGVASTVKLVELVPVPATVVTLMGPVVAPVGTLAVI